MRRHLPSPAMIVAVAALVLALTGSAVAAKKYLITSTKQVSPKVLKKLKGKTGKTGKTGPAGAPGATGATGPAGPLLDTLPSGRTLKGTYNATSVRGKDATFGVAGDSISFAIPLASAPAVHALSKGAAPTAACPGTAAEPAAAPGNLCVYEGAQVANGTTTIEDPTTQGTPGATRFGARVSVPASGGSSQTVTPFYFGSWGTWAVTAP